MRILILLTAVALLGITLTSAHALTPIPPSLNSSIVSRADTNGTAPGNDTQTWSQGDGWIPFHIVIDPAYGIAGAVLILSGIPVAVLGGKNRWSSLAIASGQALFLFALVMILRFGVQPNLAPPSPHPPSPTLRGLYLLACLISSFIGAGFGIFFFNFTKYAISAAGGFTFGWFLLALREGGLITSVVGRWALLGALTVVAFIASLPKWSNDLMTLVSTAWIGATAFVLGVDCYSRAGLKEFYIYNLGFHDLFPTLGGAKYPLTQTMIIELGILCAVVLIGAAIQFRVIGLLQKRLNRIRAEEEARIEADEVSKAAERFKNVGAELVEWEEKYGGKPRSESEHNGTEKCGSVRDVSSPSGPCAVTLTADGSRSSALLPQLGFKDSQEPPEILNKHASSNLSLLGQDISPQIRPSSSFSLVRIASDSGRGYENINPGTPTDIMSLGMEKLKPDEPSGGIGSDSSDLESKLRLLEEVRKARESVQGSLELLRSRTPSGTQSLAGPSGADTLAGLEERPRRHSSMSTRLLDETKVRPVSSASNSPPIQGHMTETPQQQSNWDTYLAERKIVSPIASSPPNSASLSVDRQHQYATIPVSVVKGIENRRERTISMLETRISDFGPAQQERRHGTLPERNPITYVSDIQRKGSATHQDYFKSGIPSPPLVANRPPMPYNGPPRVVTGGASDVHRASTSKIMSMEELAERHRQRLSKMQQPVTFKLKESERVEEAKKKWEKQRAREREEMRRRETERARENENSQGKTREVVRRTDQWRRSIAVDLESQIGGERRSNGEKAQKQGKTIVN
ncbi:hypothetical protein C364_02904 [Cryptococcus neoformans Bt63]|nr:hypothetical protein C364_02904 [Cryptococcus neoformans var. grubii Bt63]